MADFYYPPLDESTLKALSVIQQLVAENVDYFKESPYGLETEHLLAKWFRPKVVREDGTEAPNVPAADEPPKEMFEGLREEIQAAYLHLKSAKNEQHQDKVAYAKTAVLLLEKLVKMDAAVTNIEMVGNFQRAVIAFLEETCTPEQTKKFMTQVKEFISPNMEQITSIATTDSPESLD